MAYQPLYATVSDINGTRGTHSVRQRVEWVNMWLNSQFGSVLRINANSEGSLEGKDTHEAKNKIKEWQERGNQNKVKEWEQKLKEREEFNQELRKKEGVWVDIEIEANEKFNFNINGIRFSYADLKLLEQYKEKDFLGKLSVASAFAMIPDIKKLIENPTEENKQSFIEKRDKIAKFLKEEEDKLKV